MIPALIDLFCALALVLSMSGLEDPFIAFCDTAMQEVSSSNVLYSTVLVTCLIAIRGTKYKGAKDTTHARTHSFYLRVVSAVSLEGGRGSLVLDLQAATSQPVKLHQRASQVHTWLLELHSTLPTVEGTFMRSRVIRENMREYQ